jgi:hypothetical protein
MELIKKAVWKMLGVIELDSLVLIRLKSSLEKEGWFRSFKEKKSVDKNGNLIPWCVYSFIDFLEPRLKKSMIVFEYSCGSSTIWFSKRVKRTVSVEHDKKWFKEINQKKSKNMRIILEENIKKYPFVIKNNDIKYDIINIDGIERNQCVKNCLKNLSDEGVLIIDNTDRKEYEEAYDFLIKNNFKRIDFWGMGPINIYKSCTSIFYRNKNCLNI